MGVKHKIVFGLLTAVLFVGCRPKGILSSGEMRSILADLHKTDAVMQVCALNLARGEVLDIYYAQVLEKHGTTQAQFDSSIVWYTAHPVLFDKIYPKVQADLKAEHDAFQRMYAAELHLEPERDKGEGLPVTGDGLRELTVIGLDSVLWVSQHGRPTTWHPWVRPFSLYR